MVCRPVTFKTGSYDFIIDMKFMFEPKKNWLKWNSLLLLPPPPPPPPPLNNTTTKISRRKKIQASMEFSIITDVIEKDNL